MERWADCRKGYQNKYIGGTDLQSDTCTSLILLNIGASQGHSQEKLNAKRSVSSLHIRQSLSCTAFYEEHNKPKKGEKIYKGEFK